MIVEWILITPFYDTFQAIIMCIKRNKTLKRIGKSKLVQVSASNGCHSDGDKTIMMIEHILFTTTMCVGVLWDVKHAAELIELTLILFFIFAALLESIRGFSAIYLLFSFLSPYHSFHWLCYDSCDWNFLFVFIIRSLFLYRREKTMTVSVCKIYSQFLN